MRHEIYTGKIMQPIRITPVLCGYVLTQDKNENPKEIDERKIQIYQASYVLGGYLKTLVSQL
jgi:hypothetical protein